MSTGLGEVMVFDSNLRINDLRGRAEHIRAQVVPRDAGDPLDLQHATAGDAVAQPLQHRGMANSQLASEACRRAALGQVTGQASLFHDQNGSCASIQKQAALPPRDRRRWYKLQMEGTLGERFGDRLRRYRKLRGLTQAKLGDQCGATHSAVGQWERHLANPTIENLVYVADTLGVTIDVLIWGEDVASGIEARLRKIPKVLREGLILKLHQEIDETEKAAARLPKAMAGDFVKDHDARLAAWSAKNKIRERPTGRRAKKRARTQ